MTTQPEISQAFGFDQQRPPRLTRVPGLWGAAATAVASGALCWLWLSAAAAPPVSPSGDESELTAVGEQDVSAALTTMAGSAAFLAEFRDRAGGCRRPMAWVTLASEAGQPEVKLRLRSGAYLSPEFRLTDVPVRVAIPYPSPYETGRGAIAALHAGGGAMVALLPAWHVPRAEGVAAREVTWRPGERPEGRLGKRCARPNG